MIFFTLTNRAWFISEIDRKGLISFEVRPMYQEINRWALSAQRRAFVKESCPLFDPSYLNLYITCIIGLRMRGITFPVISTLLDVSSIPEREAVYTKKPRTVPISSPNLSECDRKVSSIVSGFTSIHYWHRKDFKLSNFNFKSFFQEPYVLNLIWIRTRLTLFIVIGKRRGIMRKFQIVVFIYILEFESNMFLWIFIFTWIRKGSKAGSPIS